MPNSQKFHVKINFAIIRTRKMPNSEPCHRLHNWKFGFSLIKTLKL